MNDYNLAEKAFLAKDDFALEFYCNIVIGTGEKKEKIVAHFMMALSFQDRDIAKASYHAQEAKELAGNDGTAVFYNDIGIIFLKAKQYWQAFYCLSRASSMKWATTDVDGNLATVMHALKMYKESERLFKRVLQQRKLSKFFTNYGNLLYDIGRLDEAERAHKRCLELNPTLSEVHINLANFYLNTAKYDLAEYHACEVLYRDPKNPQASFVMGILHLLANDLKIGLSLYRWRFKANGDDRKFPLERWNGSHIPGKKILITGEQGLGDNIMMFRYIPLLSEKGIDIDLACDKKLHRLFSTFYKDVTYTDNPHFENYDYYLDMMDLPLIFDSFANEMSNCYIPDVFHDNITYNGGETYGWCVTGNPSHKNDKYRSINRELFMDSEVFKYIDTEKTIELTQKALSDMGKNDILDVAKLLSDLKTVITVDTMIAHLAGTIGVPTILMLPANPDWRWLREGTASRWYPSVKIFRQKKLGDWTNVFEEVLEYLKSS